MFVTGFNVSEVLAIQQRAKALLLEGKTIMNWNDAETSASKQFVMEVGEVLEECGQPGRGHRHHRLRDRGAGGLPVEWHFDPGGLGRSRRTAD